jgi:hypothetical protein
LGTRTGRSHRLAIAATIVSAVGLAALPQQTQARDGVGTGAAVGIGLGAFALGTAVGAAPYNPYYAPSYYYPPAAYYPPAPPAYYGPYPYGPRSCWDPYYRRYYSC